MCLLESTSTTETNDFFFGRFCLFCSVLFLLLCIVPNVVGQEISSDKPLTTKRLVVGTKHSPPFAFKNANGEWLGISIELWNHIASELELEYEFREMSLDEMISGLESRGLDAAVAAISVTSERHQKIEFCHPHFTTGLGIAVQADGRTNVWNLIKRVVSKRLLKIVACMFVLIAICGFLFWRLERKVNPNMFGGRKRQGIEMGIWWSIILMLGHKGIVPVSTAGRLVAVSAMLASLMLLSVLTGVITSVLTVQQLDTGITGARDLRDIRVVTVESSTAEDYLRRRRISSRSFPTVVDAMQTVSDGKADAIVYDKPLLRYMVANDFVATMQVLPVSFNTQEYAIGLPPGSPLRKPLNTALLRYRASDLWEDMIFRYLGE